MTRTKLTIYRHRKATTDDGKPSSPRKPLGAVSEDETFGTIF